MPEVLGRYPQGFISGSGWHRGFVPHTPALVSQYPLKTPLAVMMNMPAMPSSAASAVSAGPRLRSDSL